MDTTSLPTVIVVKCNHSDRIPLVILRPVLLSENSSDNTSTYYARHVVQSARDRHNEALQLWRKRNPDYNRRWTQNFKQWRDSERTKGNNVKGNSRPRVKGNLAYEVRPTETLEEEERY